jgi:hypothetical protein
MAAIIFAAGFVSFHTFHSRPARYAVAIIVGFVVGWVARRLEKRQ